MRLAAFSNLDVVINADDTMSLWDEVPPEEDCRLGQVPTQSFTAPKVLEGHQGLLANFTGILVCAGHLSCKGRCEGHDASASNVMS